MFGVTVRLRLIALVAGIAAAGVLPALAGCGPDRAGAPQALPPVQVVQVPAASAGGACVLWTYRAVEAQIGIRFDVAASGRVDDTSTCVLQQAGAHRPDLLLSVVERSAADPALFAAELVPARATNVERLGRVAYRLVSKAAGDHGPVVEVGWLSRDRQVITVRFTFARGASKAEATAMGTRLTSLARKLDAPIGRGA